MKIAIPAENHYLDVPIIPNFNECFYFIIFNTESPGQYTYFKNPYKKTISGWEIFCAQFLISQNIDLVICSKNIDPVGCRLLIENDITVFDKQSGTVRDALKLLKRQKYF